MAKRKKTVKKPSALLQAYRRKKQLKALKPKGRKPQQFSFIDSRGKHRRDFLGRFLSEEDWQFRRKEIEARRRDYERDKRNEAARVLREQKAEKERKRKLRAKKERAWQKGARTKRGKLRKLYTDRDAGTDRSVEDSKQLSLGILPDAHTSRRIGKYSALKWVYFGDSAISTAESFIIEARSQLDAGTMGSVRIGTSYDKKRGEWVSTPILPLKATSAHGRDLLSAYFRLLASESGKNVFGEDKDVDVWVEVELLVK